mgnify:CR=1 FL=1
MVFDGASVALCCAAYGYRRASIAGDGIVFKPVGVFPRCLGHEFQSNPKVGSMGGISGQPDYDHHLRFCHPERISLNIMKKREPAHTIRSQLPHTIMMQIY